MGEVWTVGDHQRGAAARSHRLVAAAAAYGGPQPFDEKLTVVIVLALGVLIAPTAVGEGILNVLGQLVSGMTQAGR